MKVAQLMHRHVVTVTPQTSLKEVAGSLVAHSISGVPVCDPDGRVLGVVSEGDILFKERGRADRPGGPLAWLVAGSSSAGVMKAWARTAAEAMTSPAVTILAEQPAADAARLMIERGVNRLPVVDRDGLLVGIVSRADLVRAFTRSDLELLGEIRDDVLRRVLWVDPERVRIAVRAGEVELSGTLESSADADALVRLVEKVPGVVSVHSTVAHRSDEGRLARLG